MTAAFDESGNLSYQHCIGLSLLARGGHVNCFFFLYFGCTLLKHLEICCCGGVLPNGGFCPHFSSLVTIGESCTLPTKP